jgi:glycosyltransferase involved in cell wall biosynthesis
VGVRRYEVFNLGGTFSQYAKAPLVHHRTVRDWDLLVDVENGLPYFSPLWRRKPIVALLLHVHTDQWALRFPAPLAAVGRFTEAEIMPRVYRRVPFVAISESTADSLVDIGVDRDRIRILSPGVDAPAVTTVQRSVEPLFICAGRLVPHKRIDLLLRAWERVRSVVGGRLVVVGDGPDRAPLEVLAGEGVEFVGKIGEEDKWRLFGEAWFLLHTAQHEGWGIVIIEAGTMGTPSLGFDVPGVRDSIVDGVSGLLADSEDDLVRRWIELANDQALREKLGEGARQYSARFRWDEVAKEFAAIASDVVESGVR